jgi:hypothetical protein
MHHAVIRGHPLAVPRIASEATLATSRPLRRPLWPSYKAVPSPRCQPRVGDVVISEQTVTQAGGTGASRPKEEVGNVGRLSDRLPMAGVEGTIASCAVGCQADTVLPEQGTPVPQLGAFAGSGITEPELALPGALLGTRWACDSG